MSIPGYACKRIVGQNNGILQFVKYVKVNKVSSEPFLIGIGIKNNDDRNT